MTNLLSDPSTRAYKLRHVAVVSVVTLVVTLGTLYLQSPRPSVGTALAVILSLAGCVAYVVRRQLWYVADSVSELGGSLHIRRGTAEVTVPLDEVADIFPVSVSTVEGLQMTLHSVVEPFGMKVVFFPRDWQSLKGKQLDQVALEVKRRLGLAAA